MARILVIDDSMTAIEKARSVLERAGHVVSGLKMMIHLPQAIGPEPPDLILLDLSMPGLSGPGFAKVIRRLQPRPIPIILYSSQPEEELISVAKELDAFAYVRKGNTDEALLLTVARALSRSSAR